MKIMLIFFFVSPLPYLPQLQREPGIYLKQAYILGRRLFVKTIICCWCKLSILPVVLKVWENVHFLSTISISTTTSKGVILLICSHQLRFTSRTEWFPDFRKVIECICLIIVNIFLNDARTEHHSKIVLYVVKIYTQYLSNKV